MPSQLAKTAYPISHKHRTVSCALILQSLPKPTRKASLLTLYNKLPTITQLLIKAATNSKKQGNPTTDGIDNELNTLTINPTDKVVLNESFKKPKKSG